MSLKTQLNEDDWKQVVQSPFLAGFAVTAADPGGLIGAFQESAAMARSLKAADGADSQLGDDIMEELKSSEGRGMIQAVVKGFAKSQTPADASRAAVTRLAQTMSLVHTQAPDHFDDLAALLRQTAHAVAEAAKEGGFLGIGGVPVSEEEQMTLDEIDRAIEASRLG